MKKIIPNWRYYVLTALAFTIIVGLLAVPVGYHDTSVQTYLALLYGSKAAALAALVLLCLLYIRWEDADKIPELSDFANEE